MNRPMYRIFDVPLVGQQTASDGSPLMLKTKKRGLQPHGRNACWYAAACMVSYAPRGEGRRFLVGPRPGLPEIWLKDEGLGTDADSFEALMEAEELDNIERPRPITAEFLANLLKTRGPVMASGFFGGGDRHAIVVTGVDGSMVFYNDPLEPAAKTMSVTVFNSRLALHYGCLLVKREGAY